LLLSGKECLVSFAVGPTDIDIFILLKE